MFSWHSLPQRPLIIAHRGSSATAPENTLAAFRQALADGADAIELDLRLTNDREVVVIHDSRLERTTDGRGAVKDYSLKQLKNFSAGAWFSRKFRSEKIPTLAEVFQLIRGRIGINIEIKTQRGKIPQHDIVERCIDVVRIHGATNYVLISSFFHPFVKLAKELESDIATGVLYHPIRHLRKSPSALVSSSRADFFICNKHSLHSRTVKYLQNLGVHTGVYVVNTKRTLNRFFNMNVDCMYTDNPTGIIKILQTA